MPVPSETIQRLANLPNVTISQGAMLSQYTRFGIGGPAEVYFETPDQQSFMEAVNIARSAGSEHVVIGGGTNLIVADAGFPGIVLRFTASGIESEGVRVPLSREHFQTAQGVDRLFRRSGNGCCVIDGAVPDGRRYFQDSAREVS